MTPPLLILDLDETLWHATETPLNRAADFRIAPYFGAQDDDELPALLTYLRTLRDAPNYRRIEKRGWRSQV
ncbi:MAG: hypothetical protein AAF624_10390 [Bacteroidota bacterium]